MAKLMVSIQLRSVIAAGPKRSSWLDIGRAPSRSMVTEIALHYDPLIVRYLFVPDPIARLLAARLR